MDAYLDHPAEDFVSDASLHLLAQYTCSSDWDSTIKDSFVRLKFTIDSWSCNVINMYDIVISKAIFCVILCSLCIFCVFCIAESHCTAPYSEGLK